MKEEILKKLIPFFELDSEFKALWLGGSRATQKEDNLSDLDFVFIVNNSDLAFNKFEEVLKQNYKINQTWKVTEPSLYKQKFYILDNTADTFYLDVVMMTEANNISEYFNIERHGQPFIVFDKERILEKNKNLTKKQSIEFNKENESAKFEILYRTFLKEFKRNKFIDAFSFYQKLVLLLVRVKRIQVTPEKHDFALRYLYSDLAKEDSQMIESLLKVNSLDELKQKADLTKSEFFANIGKM